MHGITFFEMCSLTLYSCLSRVFSAFLVSCVLSYNQQHRCSCVCVYFEELKKRDKSIHAWISLTARTLRKVIDRQHEIRLPSLYLTLTLTFSRLFAIENEIKYWQKAAEMANREFECAYTGCIASALK